MGESKHTPGHVSQTPKHTGDGYDWGGDWIVTIGDTSINLGFGGADLAHLIAAAPEMLEALKLVWDKVLTEYHSKDSYVRQQVEAAIAKANGDAS